MSSLSPISQPPPAPPSPAVNTVPPPSPDTSVVSPPPPSPGTGNLSPSLQPPGSSNNTTLIALGVGVGIGGTVVLFAVGIFVLWYRRKKIHRAMAGSNLAPPPGPRDDLEYGLRKPAPPPGIASKQNLCQTSCRPPPLASSISTSEIPIQQEPSNALGSSKKTFTYEELNLATDGFADSNLLGQGGFGYVHKGLLSNGEEVAVKCLKIGSGQGEREFQAEVEVISRVNHEHLVSVVGYCSSGTQRILVYEFVPNSTMEFHLHGKGESTLCWETRMKIAIGAAKGLAYLHEDCQPKIIHRDVKAANILLDNNFEAKLADFGLARFSSETDTHVSTRVMGTFGYLAPEYALTGKLTEKSDIFSFGVVLLELITGRRPIDKGQFFVDDNIVDWARPLLAQALDDGKFESVADQRLKKNYKYEEMLRMVACAAVCVRHLARRRPRMSQIVRALEGNMNLDELNEGLRPGHSSIYGSHESIDYDNAQYKEDLKKFTKMALESQVQPNFTDCSGPTSEFGQHPSGSTSDSCRATPDIS